METTREETAINIAVINKVSKQVATACKLKSNDLLDEALSSGADIPALASSIIAYIKEDRDPILYKQLMHLANTDPIRKYIRTQSGYRKAGEVKEIADAVDQLDKFGNDLYYREGNGEYENLLPFFSNEEAQGLLQRAVDAGLLKDDYQPRESTARFQLKLIAICMMEIMEYIRKATATTAIITKTGRDRPLLSSLLLSPDLAVFALVLVFVSLLIIYILSLCP